MTEYALAPNSKFTTDSPYRTPRVMLEQGLLRAYRVRANGTMRHLDLLPLDSTKRETAEWINDAVDMDGRSVESVARELHISTPTVRRFLESLALTEEIEAGEWDGLSFDSAGNPVWDTAWVESEVEAEELAGNDETAPAPAPQPTRRTRTAKECTGGCGKGVTARNSAAKLRAAMGYEDMCATCYDKAGVENEHSDGHHADEPNADCPQCKDRILLDRNRARFTSSPQPTDAERDAFLADTVPGAQCEPVGTPADEVEDALEASVAQAKSAALPVCFCNDLGAHRPGGLPSCKNGAVTRKVRTRG
jgi:hypothetical protein